MDRESKARIIEEGFDLLGDAIRVIAQRPKKTSTGPERGSFPPSEMTKTAPEKEKVGKTSHEPEKPPFLASQSSQKKVSPEILDSSKETQELTFPGRPLTVEQCISCLAHNHYLAARGRIKEAIRFYNREGGFSDTVIAKVHDVMEDLITPERDDYAARTDNPVLNKMLRDMQKRGDDIKKELEGIVLDYENKSVEDLETIRDKIIDIQKAAWKLTAIEKKLVAGVT